MALFLTLLHLSLTLTTAPAEDWDLVEFSDSDSAGISLRPTFPGRPSEAASAGSPSAAREDSEEEREYQTIDTLELLEIFAEDEDVDEELRELVREFNENMRLYEKKPQMHDASVLV